MESPSSSNRQRTVSDENEKETSETTSEESEIYIEELTKEFSNGSVIACEDINIGIKGEELVVLLGPSGCGKTTTLRCIAGLEEPTNGEIEVGGQNVVGLKPKERDLAFVFQDIALFNHMSVRSNIRFGLDMNSNYSASEKNEKVEEAAQLLGISDLLDRKPAALSGGQQQRVSLGRAMVIEPKAFLLDEPFSALDAKLRGQMQTEIKQLQQRLEIPMIFVTHDQQEAMSIGDKIVVMNDGTIQQQGTPYEIYNDPTNQFVAEFIGTPPTNIIDCRLRKRKGDYHLLNDLFDIPINRDDHNGFDDVAEGTVSLGVRPENLTVNPKNQEGQFHATVDVVEPQGSRDIAQLSVDDFQLRAVVDQGELSDQNSVDIFIDTDQIWIFSPQGTRLY